MSQSSEAESVRVVLLPGRIRTGTISGVLSCIFGVLGIFAFPLIFVPIALICALAGIVAGLVKRNGRALGSSFLGVLLAIGAMLKSPTIMISLGVIAATMALSTHHATTPTSPAVKTSASVSLQTTAPLVPMSAARPSSSPGQDLTTMEQKIWDIDRRIMAIPIDNAIEQVQQTSISYQGITAAVRTSVERFPGEAAAHPEDATMRRNQISAISDPMDSLRAQLREASNALQGTISPLNSDIDGISGACAPSTQMAKSQACVRILADVLRLRDRMQAYQADVLQNEAIYKSGKRRPVPTFPQLM